MGIHANTDFTKTILLCNDLNVDKCFCIGFGQDRGSLQRFYVKGKNGLFMVPVCVTPKH